MPSSPPPEETTQEASLWQNVKKVPFAQPDRYITAASRSTEGDLAESVALLQGQRGDITSALHTLEPATYWVRFERIDRPNEATTPPVQIKWHPGASAEVINKTLNLGLYRLYLVEPTGEPTGSEAWVFCRLLARDLGIRALRNPSQAH